MSHYLTQKVLAVIVIVSLLVPVPPAALTLAAPPSPTPPSATPTTIQHEPQAVPQPPPAQRAVTGEETEARVRQAFETALVKYNAYWGPRVAVSLAEMRVEDGWASAVAEPSYQEQTAAQLSSVVVRLLARQAADGSWLAIMPGHDEYLKWLAEAPETVIPQADRTAWEQAAAAPQVAAKPYPAVVPQPVLPALSTQPPAEPSQQPTPASGPARVAPAPAATPPTPVTRDPGTLPSVPRRADTGLMELEPVPQPAKTGSAVLGPEPTPTPVQQSLPSLRELQGQPWPLVTPEPAQRSARRA